jgi:rubrerythrin
MVPENIRIIHVAIDREKAAISAYLTLARISKDVNAKNVLINLASDEVGHMTKLENHLTSLLEGKAWILPKADEPEEAAVPTPSSELEEIDEGRLAKADEIRFLEIAIDKEIKANRFYLDMAKKALSPEAKDMFLSLAKEEDVHAKILQAEVDSLGQNGFWFDMQEFTMEMPEG